jgi:hypothetical protein
MRFAGSAPGLLMTILLVSACASGGASRGDTGGIQWEVLDMKRSPDPSGGLRFTYTIVLREGSGHTITFERVHRNLMPNAAHPDAYSGGFSEYPFARTLGPGAELRIDMTERLTSPAGMTIGTSMSGARAALAKRWRLLGRRDDGRDVTVDVPVTLDPR